MTPCDDLPLAEFLRGDLDPAAEGAVAQHLADCQLCLERLLIMQCLDAVCLKDQESAARRTLWKRRVAAALVAAAITLPLAIREPAHPELDYVKLATDQKHVDFPLRTRSRQVEAPIRRRALDAYAQEDFARAELLFSELPEQPEILFYRGVSLYLLGEVDRAIPLLERVRNGNSRWTLPAAWYQANCLLKKGNRAYAVKLLTELAVTPGSYREQSRTLMKALGEDLQ